MKKTLPLLAAWLLQAAAIPGAEAQRATVRPADATGVVLTSGAPVAAPRPAEPTRGLPQSRAVTAWTAVASLSTARGQAAAVAIGGKIYVWGGYNSPTSASELSSLEIYDVATNTWSAGPSLPVPVRGQAYTLGADGQLYSLGGVVNGSLSAVCFRYNPATSTWASISGMPAATFQAKATTGPDGRIYVIGGSTTANSVQIYNPTTNSWTAGAALPVGRNGQAQAMDAAGLVHVIAGNESFSNSDAITTHSVYSPVADTWSTAAALPSAVQQAGAAFGTDGAIYVLGGKAGFGNNTGPFFNTVYAYNPGTNTWSTGATLPVTRGETAAVSVGTSLYCIGGTDGTFQNTVYRANLGNTYTWIGAASTDWNTGSNWSGGVVPTASDDVIIPVGRTQPVVSTSTPTAHSVTVDNGATLTVGSGGTLTLTGDFINNGTLTATGLVRLTGPIVQSLGGSSRTSFWDLTVGPAAATLTGGAVDVQRVLTLTGNLATNGRTLTLLSNATATAMVVNNGGVVSGTATVQRYLNPSLNGGLGYRHYSSPVQSTTVADLATSGFTPVVNDNYNTVGNSVTPFPTVYGFNESRITGASATTQAFEYGYFSPASLGAPLTPGRGYTVNLAASEKVDLTGTLNTGTVAVGALSRGAEANSGWQLLGNPYPAPLDWKKARLSLPTGVQDAIYVYKSSGQYDGTYQTYQNGVGTLPNGIVGSMQGFFLRVSQTVPAFSFQDAWRATSYEAADFNRPATETRPYAQLDLVSAQGVHDPAFVYFEQGATAGFDVHYDAEKLSNTTGLNLSSQAGGLNLAVNGLPPVNAPTTVPLAVGVPTTGPYTLTAVALLNLANTDVFLHDAETGQQVNLKQQPSYSFSASNAALITDRFTLSFGPLAPLATKASLTAASVSLYPNPAHKNLTVLVPAVSGVSQAKLTLCNVLGQPVRTATLALPAAGAQTSLDVQSLPAGVYLLRVQAGPTTITKRVVLN